MTNLCIRQERIANEILMHFRGKRKSAGDVYINDPIDTDREGNSLTLLDIMSYDDDIIDRIDLENRSRQLRTYVESLPEPRERQIITMRYGLGGGLPMTQREVAKKLGISRSYVSRIEKRAVQRLRARFGTD